jgi:hypothetical protein
MVKGAEYRFVFTVINKKTGQPITDPELVADIRLALGSSASKDPLKGYKVNDGITALGDGKYRIVISPEDTLLLPDTGRALLQGFTLPFRKSVKFDLGNITKNLANSLADE